MYRNRLWIWAVMLLIVSIVSSFSNADVKGLLKENHAITVEFQTDAVAKSIFTKNIYGVCLKEVNKDADVIIRQPSTEIVPGYSQIDDFIYSPIILYANTKFVMPPDLFYRLGEYAYFVNMQKVAEAVINEKTLGELGITTNNEYKDVKLTLNLPSQGTFYYDKTIEQIYIGLNGNKIPTDEERENLKKTVDALIEKSVECNDMMKKLGETNEFQLYMGPEFLANNLNKNYYYAVYFEKSVAFEYEVLVRDERKESVLPAFIEQVIQNKKFPSTTFFRTSYSHNYENLCDGVRSVEIVR